MFTMLSTRFTAADPGTRAVKSVGPNIDNGITLIVTVAVCVCLVVMTAVVTAGIVCCVKGKHTQNTEFSNDIKCNTYLFLMINCSKNLQILVQATFA